MIRIIESTQVGRMLARKAARFADAEEVVRPILNAVRTRGDKAIFECSRKFDQLDRASVVVKPAELLGAEKTLAPKFRAAVKTASKNIRAFAKLQLPLAKQAVIAPGIRVGQIIRP